LQHSLLAQLSSLGGAAQWRSKAQKGNRMQPPEPLDEDRIIRIPIDPELQRILDDVRRELADEGHEMSEAEIIKLAIMRLNEQCRQR
jgi:hypothetical protein